jgi:hypothetical protein
LLGNLFLTMEYLDLCCFDLLSHSRSLNPALLLGCSRRSFGPIASCLGGQVLPCFVTCCHCPSSDIGSQWLDGFMDIAGLSCIQYLCHFWWPGLVSCKDVCQVV